MLVALATGGAGGAGSFMAAGAGMIAGAAAIWLLPAGCVAPVCTSTAGITGETVALSKVTSRAPLRGRGQTSLATKPIAAEEATTAAAKVNRAKRCANVRSDCTKLMLAPKTLFAGDAERPPAGAVKPRCCLGHWESGGHLPHHANTKRKTTTPRPSGREIWLPHYIIALMSRGLWRSTGASDDTRSLVRHGHTPTRLPVLGRAFAELNALPPSCDGAARHGVGWCPATGRQRLSPRLSSVALRLRCEGWSANIARSLPVQRVTRRPSGDDKSVNWSMGRDSNQA